MSRSFRSATATTFLLFTLCISVAAQSNQQKLQQTIAFTVAMPKPHTHLLDVEIHIKREPGKWPVEDFFIMPVWTPSSYLVREFARHVQDFDARNATGAALDWEKVNKNSWKVKANGIGEYRVSYRVL